VWWRAAAFLAIGLVLALGLLGAIVVLAFPLALLLAAVVLAAALAPAIDWLERRLPRAAAAAAVYATLVLALGALGWYIGPRLAVQGGAVLGLVPTLLEQVQAAAAGWNPAVAQGVERALETGAEIGTELLIELPLQVLAGALSAILVLVMSVYWTLASADVRRFSFAFLPQHLRDEASAVTQEVVATMGGYVRVRGLTALIVGAVTYGGLLVAGVPYPLALALLAGAGELLPIVGPLVAAVPAVGAALLISPAHALVVGAFYAFVQQVKSHLLVPYLANRHADIPPLLVIFAVLAGGWVGDGVGALLGPPFAGALRIVLVRVIAPALHRWTNGRSAAPPPLPDTPEGAAARR
jgi:predicted PurR-regulated permease PerM